MTLEVKNLTKSFEGRKVLDNISFHVDNGQTLGVVGFSGSGKSTLLNNFRYSLSGFGRNYLSKRF